MNFFCIRCRLFMKATYKMLPLLGILFISSVTGEAWAAKRKLVLPEKCRASKYSCIVKKVDGNVFLCVRTAKQRQRNARRRVKIVKQMNCVERYPVVYKEAAPSAVMRK
ncbi:MAG: hypothetical protein COB67_00695 [SAR324 cluster bacterium]|uniref:Uncharacterized protein n=1 Tax=SAR324 cluster bacterium TaxID=2024889 RepID=A0A2A4TAY0_9DELT|nr:MAG: hypothetical protein COB67_00695 [SAR324 cluster bacterium]